MNRLGLIGNPVSHSQSPEIFNKFFSIEGLNNWIYELFPLNDLSEFPQLLLKYPDLTGLNVTIPYKSEILKYIDILTPEAELTGAVNTITIRRDKGKAPLLTGFNTDVSGFKRSLTESFDLQNIHAMILGTGGASKSVKVALEQLNIPFLSVSRDPGKGLAYLEFTREIMKDHTLIINTTPLGMYPNTATRPEIPYQWLTPHHLCFDLIYNPRETQFLQMAAARGAQVKNGWDMLRYQAEEAWEIFKQFAPSV